MLLADGRLSATFLPQQVKVEEGEVDAAWMVMRCRWRRGGGDGGGGRGGGGDGGEGRGGEVNDMLLWQKNSF